jgi:hypothetical protein
MPWVWNEVAITYAQGRYWLRGAAAAFPTTWWYKDGNRMRCQPRLSDEHMPVEGGGLAGIGGHIDTARLNLWPALSTGQRSWGPGGAERPQVTDSSLSGPIFPQPFTLGTPSTPGHWRMPLDGPPDESLSSDPAC